MMNFRTFMQSMLKIFSLFFYLSLFSKTVFAKDYYLWIEIKVHCSGDVFQITEGGKFVDVNGHPVSFYMQSLAGRTHTSYNRGTVSSDVFNLEQNVFDFKIGVGGSGKTSCTHVHNLYITKDSNNKFYELQKKGQLKFLASITMEPKFMGTGITRAYANFNFKIFDRDEWDQKEKKDEERKLKEFVDKQIEDFRATIKKLGDVKIGDKTLRQIFKDNQGNCFSGDTKVLTEGKSSSLEYKQIKDITLEDKVWTCSYSDQTCKLRHPKKLGKRYTEDGEMVLLVLENDQGVSTEIEVTNEHPFNTGERSWTQVANLKEGDTLWDVEGKQHTVVSKTPMEGVFEVYNLEIGSGDYDDDNYYVSEMGILSHNCSIIGGSLMAASLLALPSGQIALFGTMLGMGISIRGMAQAPDFESAIEGALVDAAVTMAGGLAIKGVARLAHMTPAQKLFEAMKNGMLKPVEDMIGKIANSAKTIYGRMSNVAPNWPSSKIPQRFDLKVGADSFHVHPNATKHMAEKIANRSQTHGMPMESQITLAHFEGAVKDAVSSGAWKNSMETGKLVKTGGWELKFSKRPDDPLPVIIHARMLTKGN